MYINETQRRTRDNGNGPQAGTNSSRQQTSSTKTSRAFGNMGKPKALRSRDVIPSIGKEKTANSKKSFEDVDEICQTVEDSTSSTKFKKEIVKDAEDDVPEEVSMNNNEEILRLRELHEKLAEGGLRKSKRRKVATEKSSSTIADVALDQSIFSSLEEAVEENAASEEDDGEERVGWKIDAKASKSVKIGGVEVAVLEQRAQLDPIKSFAVSRSAEKFAAAASGSNPRVKYSTFARQKKVGPAMQFAAVKC